MNKEKAKNLLQRVISGVLLAAATLSLIWIGVLPFAILVAALAGIGMDEFFKLAERKGLRPERRLGHISGVLLLFGSAFLSENQLTRLLMVSIISICVVTVLRGGEKRSTFLDGAATVLGVVYLGWMFSFLIQIRRLDQGAALVTLLIFASAFNDMGGYFVGKWLGRTKLTSISPGKTVEGSLGGVLFSICAVWVVGGFLGVSPFHRFAMAVLVAVVGQLGDLFESALKREAGVKDSGTAIAGHGGALDRFDSLAFAAPVYYLYVVTFML